MNRVDVAAQAWQSLVAWAATLGWIATMFFFERHFGRRFVRWAIAVSLTLLGGWLLLLGSVYQLQHRKTLVAPGDAFAVGVAQMWEYLLYPLVGGHRRDVQQPGFLAYLFLISVGLAIFFFLETCGAHGEAPSLQVDQPGGDTDLERRVGKQLTFRLPALEVRQPSVAPGGSTTTAAATVAAELSWTESQKRFADAVATFLRAVGKLWPRPKAYGVRFALEDPEPGSTSPRRITVDLHDVETQRSILVNTLAPAPESELAERVAAFAAAEVFRRDRSNPPWMRWNDDGSALAEYLLAKQDHPKLPTDRSHLSRQGFVAKEKNAVIEYWGRQAKRLRTAHHSCPGNGLLRYELAGLCELERRNLRALRLYLLNRRDHPTFYDSRYRLCVALVMAANDPRWLVGYDIAVHRCLDDEIPIDRAHLLDSVCELLGDCHIRCDSDELRSDMDVLLSQASENNAVTMPAGPLRHAFLRLAEGELTWLDGYIRWWCLLWTVLKDRRRRRQAGRYLRNAHARRGRKGAHRQLRNLIRVVGARLVDSASERDQHAATSAVADSLDVAATDPSQRQAWWRLFAHRHDPAWQERLNAALTIAAAGQDLAHRNGLAPPYQLLQNTPRLIRLCIERATTDPECELRYPSVWLPRDPVVANLLVYDADTSDEHGYRRQTEHLIEVLERHDFRDPGRSSVAHDDV